MVLLRKSCLLTKTRICAINYMIQVLCILLESKMYFLRGYGWMIHDYDQVLKQMKSPLFLL